MPILGLCVCPGVRRESALEFWVKKWQLGTQGINWRDRFKRTHTSYVDKLNLLATCNFERMPGTITKSSLNPSITKIHKLWILRFPAFFRFSV